MRFLWRFAPLAHFRAGRVGACATPLEYARFSMPLMMRLYFLMLAFDISFSFPQTRPYELTLVYSRAIARAIGSLTRHLMSEQPISRPVPAMAHR